jgi:hypothetical protein
MKKLGFSLLMIGFLCGAFVIVRDKDAVNWWAYAPCAGVMLLGLICVRMRRADLALDHDRRESDLRVIESSLSSLVEKLDRMLGDRTDVYELRTLIDERLMNDLNAFVEVRETLIERFGLQQYADLMTAFATSERYINRAWSASADGYVDEVWRSLGIAAGEMKKARDLLSEYRGR